MQAHTHTHSHTHTNKQSDPTVALYACIILINFVYYFSVPGAYDEIFKA